MSTAEVRSAWDFTPVINLLHSFDAAEGSCVKSTKVGLAVLEQPPKLGHVLPLSSPSPGANDGRRLGDFGDLWKLLADPLTPQNKELGTVDKKNKPSSEAKNNHYSQFAIPSAPNQQKASIETALETPTKPKNIQPKRILQRPQVIDPKPTSRTDQTAVSDPEASLPLSSSAESEDNGDHGLPRSLPELRSPISFKLNHHTVNKTPSKSTRVPGIFSSGKLSPSKSKNHIEPLLPYSKAERKGKLIMLLLTRFSKERDFLLRPHLRDPALGLKNTHAKGVHVFIDISNIMVGFHDSIKEARDMPLTARIPRVPLSFHNFSLILERGRAVSKRVLVGSDRFAAIDEADQIGYETNILERVHKAKDMTPRQKKFLNTNGMTKVNGIDNNSRGLFSGSETSAGRAQERWVEQAVDEILHLKILESLVDTETPSTIVLATGDAAEAEYSGGFLKMVERALQKGWAIELVSFRSTTSRAYSRKEFRSKWGSKFQMIHLDEYVEYMLDL
ncbi:hypothetical protein AJ80_01721 [Polytolypa hystricis UAMH7299]|uniref:NYN domain-containing protein n=1 Tax=Polytolypa hystricis (strain UAMH7299) TaxID=1447883 RepID=A0A2B7Z0I7_POLH7|nr:hypothetical protein AJ80_01721 [Polytolypa hystricis UAMH7299]